MKRTSLAIVAITLIISSVTLADDAVEQPSVELELSKTLTLNPAGTAPARTPELTSARPEPETPDSGTTFKWAALLALLGVPLFYWLGRRQQQARLVDAHQTQGVLSEQVSSLKEALIESGSGARDQWQSTLTSLQAQLREKSQYIDRIHDQQSSSNQQLVHIEHSLREQNDKTELLEKEHQSALEQSAQEWQQQLDTQSEQAQKLAAERDDTRTKLGEVEAELSSAQENHTRLSAELEAATAQLEAQLTESSRLSSEHDDTASRLAEVEAELNATREDHSRVSAQLEASQSQLDPQRDQIAQLAAELATLKKSNDESLVELAQQNQSNAELVKELENARAQHEELQRGHEQEQQKVQHELSQQQIAFSETLETEQQTFTRNAEQQVEEFNSRIGALEEAVVERESRLREMAEELERTHESAQAALDDRDHDLAALVAKLASLEASNDALTQVKLRHDSTLIELQEKSDQVAKLEQDLTAAKTELEDARTVEHRLQKAEADLAQMQSIIVETEQALNDARAALVEQTSELESQAKTAESYQAGQDASAEKMEHVKAQLASVTERVESETERANSEQAAREAIEERFGQREHEYTEMGTTILSLKSEHTQQIDHINSLNSNVEQLENTLGQHKEKHAQALSELELSKQNLVDLNAKAEQSEVLKEHIEKLEAQLKLQQSEHAQTLQQLQSANDERSGLQTKVEQSTLLGERLEKLEERLENKELELAHTLDQLQLAGDKQAELEGRVERSGEQESRIKELEAQLSEQESGHAQTLSELQSATDQHAKLEAKIEQTDLLDSHIEELEAQLKIEKVHNSESDAQLNEVANQRQKLEEQSKQHVALQTEFDSLKLKLNTKSQAHEHLKKTLNQARKYRQELEENISDLERENRELSETSTKTRQELGVSNESLQKNIQLLGERNQQLHELQSKLQATTTELATSRTEVDGMWSKADELTASIAKLEEQAGDGDDGADEDAVNALREQLEQAQSELSSRNQLLKETSAARDELERNASALHKRLAQAQQELESKTERAATLGAQLVEFDEQRERNLREIAILESQVNNAEVPAPETESRDEALRARENIIAALEKQMQNADITIAGLSQKLEDLQLAARAETRVDEPSDEPISPAELEKLKLALVSKSRLVRSLSNEVKVNKDLVRVFENDSNLLHDTEVELDSAHEHNQFLQHELAKAVTENQTLKSELDKVAQRLARHQNIGRTVSEDARLQQLKSRLDLLENENRQQLEMIARLRSQQESPG